MTINDAGLNIIKEFEGCRLQAYQDIAGLWTIGWGHVSSYVKPGLVITQAQADEQLLQDLSSWEKRVSDDFPDLNSNQFSALVSLCFNVGSGPLMGHIGEYINSGDMDSAATGFLAWNHSEGVVVEGLSRRRQAESVLFRATS